jgi:hypothetical protein
MHQHTLRLSVALITFALGVTASVFWVIYYSPTNKKIEKTLIQPPLSCFPGLGLEIKTVRSNQEGYFPENILDSDPNSSKFLDSSYSKRLRAMNESSLLQLGNSSNFNLRFLWLRSFHPPVAISVQQTGDKYSLTVKQLSKSNGKELDTLVVSRTRILTNDEWSTFRNLFEDICFWNIPSYSPEPLSEDGAWWVLEVVWEGRYHVVNRQSPENGPYREACLYLLKLSGLEIDLSNGEVY